MLLVIQVALQNGKRMIAEGKLEFEVAWDGKQITGAVVNSSRPVLACRVLEGKPAAQAVASVPLLFSICGRAQTVAAATALEAASGRSMSTAVGRLRELAVAAECAQEHLWRFLLDLPVLLGEPPRSARFVVMRRRFDDLRARAASGTAWWAEAGDLRDLRAWRVLAGDLAEFLENELLGMAPARFLELADEEDIAAWLERGKGLAAPLLARLRDAAPVRDDKGEPALMTLPSAAALAGEFASAIAGSDGFAAAPVLGGAPLESGALAREARTPAVAAMLARRGRSAGLRLFARLMELARLAGRMRDLSHGVNDSPWLRMARDGAGAGLAAVETARGVLIHWAVVDGGQVARYRVVAPTEWNFHPQGAFVSGLAGIPARDESAVRQAAALLAHALDPCVAYDLEVKHA
jgi:coenzyme F420-reducing hydrogenase alpha subunit